MKNKDNKESSKKVKVTSFGVATLLIFTFSFSTVSAQEIVNTSGGNATGSGGSASYSVGQVVYKSHVGTSGSVSQGVQQSYVVLVENAIEEATGVNLSVSAYPNPTTDYLTLSIEEFDISNLSYQLFDIHGKLLQKAQITDNKTTIVMIDFVSANFFVKVVQGNKEVKTFKIVKK